MVNTKKVKNKIKIISNTNIFPVPYFIMQGFKLFIQPFLAISLILLFKLSGFVAMEIIILTAIPTVVIVSMFVEKYDAYKKETVNAIVVGSILSVVTLVLFTVLAGYF